MREQRILVAMSSWWRHQMETFSTLLALCAGNSPVTGEFSAQRPVTRVLVFSLIYAWINAWVNNREAGDLRRHSSHYDVTIMISKEYITWNILSQTYFYPCQIGVFRWHSHKHAVEVAGCRIADGSGGWHRWSCHRCRLLHIVKHQIPRFHVRQ